MPSEMAVTPSNGTGNGHRKSMTSAEFSKAVEEGQQLMIHEKKVLDVGKWIAHHPGGEDIIRAMVGRDATIAINSFHEKETLATRMKYFVVADFVAETPKDKLGEKLTEDFEVLRGELRKEGLFERGMDAYWDLFSFLAISFLAIHYLIHYHGDSWVACTIAALLINDFWRHEFVIMHDTGHTAFTQYALSDKIVCCLIANFFSGFSYTWWIQTHFQHHVSTNEPAGDPHVQLLPFIAVTNRFFASVYSTFLKRTMKFDTFARCCVSVQHIIYIPFLILSRFFFYFETWRYMIFQCPFSWSYFFEVVGFVFYWTWLGQLVMHVPDTGMRIYFFVILHVMAALFHLQLGITHAILRHDTEEESKDHYLITQCRNTMDIDAPGYLSWFHVGLQFHLAHHLFPRASQYKLEKITKRVAVFCQERNLPYNVKCFSEICNLWFANLRNVAYEARQFKLCD